jgi:hypothetical protein
MEQTVQRGASPDRTETVEAVHWVLPLEPVLRNDAKSARREEMKAALAFLPPFESVASALASGAHVIATPASAAQRFYT